MPTRRTAILALLLGFTLAASAASEERPIITIKTRDIEASLTIEASLKAYPGLYENLRAEGRRKLEKWRAEAAADRKSDPDIFADGRHYEFERSYTRRSAIGRYVSILREDYLDSLGAHPNHATNTILWDAEAKKRISIRPFFKETADGGPTLRRLARAIRVALAVEKRARDIDVADPDTDSDLARVEPKLLAIGALALAPSTEADKSAGLISYFSPYAVGSYAEGPYTAFVPWTAFKADLSPQGLALFGGERPKGDEKND